MTTTVSRRLVFLFPGFEPMLAADHLGRLSHAAKKTAEVFGCAATLRETGSAGDRPHLAESRWVVDGEGWRTETDLLLCGWGDLVLAYGARPGPTRLVSGLRAMADFAVTGTFFRYCRTSWRYALFFLFPLVVMLGGLALGLLAALAPRLAGLGAAHFAWSLPLGLALAALLLRRANRRFHLLVAMDDWAMAADLCRGRAPAVERRIDGFAEALATRLADEERYDEILVAAHSLGSSFAVLALARALDGVPARAGLGVLTVGSSLMKTALHPAARRQREAVAALVGRHRLPWLDVQAITDPINFYRSHPARSLGIGEGRMPSVMRISLRRQLAPETFRRIRLDFFRLHRQFVLGNERRRPYAFPMILFGPVPFARVLEAQSVDLPPLLAEPPAGREPIAA